MRISGRFRKDQWLMCWGLAFVAAAFLTIPILSPLGNAASIQLPKGCPSSAYPVTFTANGSTVTACSIYSPEQRSYKATVENETTSKLRSSSLVPSPVMWVIYDPLSSKFFLALSRNLTASELNTVQSQVPGSFSAEILKTQLTAVCDQFTSPPDGVCEQHHGNAAGSLGFRAQKYICGVGGCGWVNGGTTWSHDSTQNGETVYQPGSPRAYGTIYNHACANGVDASFFVENAGQSDMGPSMYSYGPVWGVYSGTPPTGTILAHIGRYSGSVDYYAFLDVEQKTTCATSGSTWVMYWYSGPLSGPGDSGSGVGVAVNQFGTNGVYVAGIEWGTAWAGSGPCSTQCLLVSPWGSVTSALGIQSF